MSKLPKHPDRSGTSGSGGPIECDRRQGTGSKAPRDGDPAAFARSGTWACGDLRGGTSEEHSHPQSDSSSAQEEESHHQICDRGCDADCVRFGGILRLSLGSRHAAAG